MFAVFPVFEIAAFGRRQPALINVAHGAQIGDGRGHHVVRPLRLGRGVRRREGIVLLAFDQRALGKEHVRHDAQAGEIVADFGHHHVGGAQPHDRQPLGLRHLGQLVVVIVGQFVAAFDQIIAGVKPFRDLADVLADRLAVTEEGGAGQHIDLGAGIVDVIFAGDVKTGGRQQTGQGVAEHRAAAVADMQRAGRVGRDIFDIDLLAGADGALAVGLALLQHGAQRVAPDVGLERQIDEAGPGDIDLVDQAVGAQRLGDFIGQIAGFWPASLASTMAALVAMSPWLASRGGSTTMRDRSA